MIRQIFIAKLKAGVSESEVEERMQAQRALKDKVEGVVDIAVGRSLNLYGVEDAVVMTIDLADNRAWDNLMASDYHTQLGNDAPKYYDVDSFVAAQVEI